MQTLPQTVLKLMPGVATWAQVGSFSSTFLGRVGCQHIDPPQEAGEQKPAILTGHIQSHRPGRLHQRGDVLSVPILTGARIELTES